MRVFKNSLALFLAVSLLIVPQLSCTETEKVQTDTPLDFTLFTPVSPEAPAIEEPTLAWIYQWTENDNLILETRTAPRPDSQGNCYFVGRNGYLYSVDQNGETRWIQESFEGGKVSFFNPIITKDKVIVTEEGVLVVSKSLKFYSLENGEFLWDKKNCSKDTLLSPNGTLFSFTNDDKLIGIDSKGQTMWTIDVPKNCLVDNGFFDTESNGYFLVVDVGSKTTESDYSLLKVSPTGELIWKKSLPQNRLERVLNFLPDNTVQNTFLLAFTTLPYPKKEQEVKEYVYKKNEADKIIKAYNLDFELIWEKTISTSGVFPGNYAIDENNNIYTYFNEYNYGAASFPLVQSHINCYSKEGEENWTITYDKEIAHCPIFDIDNNLYFWLNDTNATIRSLSSEGTPRWKLQLKQAHGCKYPLTISPTGAIYTTSYQQNLLFCVK